MSKFDEVEDYYQKIFTEAEICVAAGYQFSAGNNSRNKKLFKNWIITE